jgi:hypothetical protein
MAVTRNFTFRSAQDSADILLVGKNNHQSNQYCEDAVKGFSFIKNEKDKYHKGYPR